MKSSFNILAALFILSLPLSAAAGQNVQYRDTKANLSVGAGVFTYHGPTNLLAIDSATDYSHKNDPAVAVLGSFPLLEEWIHFRFMLLFTNFDTVRGERILQDGSNDFLTRNLMVFEPTLVFNIRSLSNNAVVPYVFTGFGGVVADPLGSQRNIVDMPGSGIPGPERTAFHIPIGIGVDYAIGNGMSIFGEASYRLDMNYAFRNELEYEPHSTTLLMGGLRLAIGKTITPIDLEPPVRCDPMIPGSCPPPLPICTDEPCLPIPIPMSCPFAELTPIIFKGDSAELTDDEKQVLDDNIVALLKNQECCAEITGLAGGKDLVRTRLLADARAHVVRDYLLDRGIYPSRFMLFIETIDTDSCKNDSVDGKCLARVMVTIVPIDCATISRPR